MLYKLAVSVGAKIIFNSGITSVSVDEVNERPFVTLADGSIIEADVVLGADGYQSLVRSYVNAMEGDVEETGQSFYTCVHDLHLSFLLCLTSPSCS
jgi:salicylate hydroxylase